MASSSSAASSTTATNQSFPVIVNKELVSLLKTVKEMDLISTYAEVMEGLRLYILNRRLFDPLLPIKIHCKGDPLGKIFGVNEFTIYEVRNFLTRLVLPIRIHNISAGTMPSTSSSTNENSLKRKSEVKGHAAKVDINVRNLKRYPKLSNIAGQEKDKSKFGN